MKKNLILVGGGGHCKSIIAVVESSEQYIIKGILDRPEKVGNTIAGYEVVGTDDNFADYVSEQTYFLVAVGQIKQAVVRRDICQRIFSAGGQLATVVASTAFVSDHAQLAPGVTVGHQAVVNTGAQIETNCIINTGAIIEHDAHIEAHCHISTGAVVNGDCQVAAHCFVGSNAVLNHGVKLAESSIIGAGSVVIADTTEAGIYVGNPAVKKSNL